MQTITELDTEKLQTISLKVREHIVRMSTAGGCFTGASLSASTLR